MMALEIYMSLSMNLEVISLNSDTQDSTPSETNEANKRVRSTVKKTKNPG